MHIFTLFIRAFLLIFPIAMLNLQITGPAYGAEAYMPISVELIAKSTLNQEEISKLRKTVPLKTTTRRPRDISYYNVHLYDTRGQIISTERRINAEAKKLDVLFKRVDINKDGSVAKEEFLRRIKLEIAAQWFQSMDQDNNNLITRNEIALYNPPRHTPKQPNIIYQ